MSSMKGITARGRKILFAAVTEYIATGNPVGSRTLSRKYALELSPATIRNVLSDLEDAGFLQQPHTSAGRVPTERALRSFIEALTDFHEVPLPQKTHMRHELGEIFAKRNLGSDALRRTGQYLSELSGAAAVVAVAPKDVRVLAQLRFIVTKPDQLLAVLVFSDGMVENRYVQLDEAMNETGLLRVHNLLADVVEGRSLAALRDLFKKRLDDDRSEVDQLRRRAFELGQKALSGLIGDAGQVVIEGSARLMDMPEYGDVDRLKKLVVALEDRAHLVGLLDQTMGAGAVSVYIGSETGEFGEAELSLVVASYGDEASSAGTVGVLGPTRMDYAKMMPLVGATAAAITAALKRGPEDG
jgi:heat-inducible transcriptional repressor